MIAAGDYIEMLMPSQFGQSTELLEQFAHELGVESREKARQRDPLEFVLNLNALLYSKIAYVPKSTRVDSPIDHALESRQGVCQDFAHIMIGLTRRIGIPCRYVSGYLFHKAGDKTRSAEGATHAWVEALLPGLGWVGLDPTNNVLAGERHVRTVGGPRLRRRSSHQGRLQGIGRKPVAGGRARGSVRCAAAVESELGMRRLVAGVARGWTGPGLGRSAATAAAATVASRELVTSFLWREPRWRGRRWRFGGCLQRLLRLRLFHRDIDRLFQQQRLVAGGLHQQLQAARFHEGGMRNSMESSV